VVVLLLLLAAAGGGLWYFLGRGTGEDAVYIMPVSSCAEFGTGAANRFSGVVEAEQTVDYKLDSSKTLLETLVEEGDVVHVGDVLFRYDTDSIKLEISQKKLDIQGLRAQITSNNERIAATADDLEKMSLRNENQQTEYRIKAAQNELNA
jgi:HlyD family secretion protein